MFNRYVAADHASCAGCDAADARAWRTHPARRGSSRSGRGHSRAPAPPGATGYLVSGRLESRSRATASIAEPGSSWSLPADLPHGATALEDAVVVEVFSPVREDYMPARRLRAQPPARRIRSRLGAPHSISTRGGARCPPEAAMEAARILRDGSLFQWYVITPVRAGRLCLLGRDRTAGTGVGVRRPAFWAWTGSTRSGTHWSSNFTNYGAGVGGPGQDRLPDPDRSQHRDHLSCSPSPASRSARCCRRTRACGAWASPTVCSCRGERAFCVVVEIWLNAVGALTWDYSWWNLRSPIPIFLSAI